MYKIKQLKWIEEPHSYRASAMGGEWTYEIVRHARKYSVYFCNFIAPYSKKGFKTLEEAKKHAQSHMESLMISQLIKVNETNPQNVV